MDSSSISDGEIQIQLLKLSAAELAEWIIEKTDQVFLASGDDEASEFRQDLIDRVTPDLPPEEDHEIAEALVQIWSSTDLNESGERVVVGRAERRRREADLRKRCSIERSDGEIRPVQDDGMTVDANGEVLMDAEKLAAILEVPVEEVNQHIEQLVEENPELAGYAPGLDVNGNIVPLRVFGD